jgi:hypothetical protein
VRRKVPRWSPRDTTLGLPSPAGRTQGEPHDKPPIAVVTGSQRLEPWTAGSAAHSVGVRPRKPMGDDGVGTLMQRNSLAAQNRARVRDVRAVKGTQRRDALLISSAGRYRLERTRVPVRTRWCAARPLRPTSCIRGRRCVTCSRRVAPRACLGRHPVRKAASGSRTAAAHARAPQQFA